MRKVQTGSARDADANLRPTALAYARDLATKVSPRCMRVIKRQLWNALVQDQAEAMTYAHREMALSPKSDDFKEGVASFVKKRAARWVGAQFPLQCLKSPLACADAQWVKSASD